MKVKFVVCVGNNIPPEHPTFEAAFVAFFDEVKAMVIRGTSWQVLETACWIEGIFESEVNGKIARGPLYFYDAKDFAHDVGILVETDGKAVIADPLPSVPLEKVIDVYTEACLEAEIALIDTEIAIAIERLALAIE